MGVFNVPQFIACPRGIFLRLQHSLVLCYKNLAKERWPQKNHPTFHGGSAAAEFVATQNRRPMGRRDLGSAERSACEPFMEIKKGGQVVGWGGQSGSVEESEVFLFHVKGVHK